MQANYVVVHLGASKDKSIDEVFMALRLYLESYDSYIEQEAQGVKLLVENCAAAYPFNVALKSLAEVTSQFKNIGWTLDLAHSNAAGVLPEDLLKVIEEKSPTVCHANYPGSDWGSGLDRHAFACEWEVGDTKLHRYAWREAVTSLIKKKVPLIMEGASDSQIDISLEIEYVQKIIKEIQEKEEKSNANMDSN